MEQAFTVRGTANGNTTVRFDGGHEVNVATGNSDAVASAIAQAYFTKYPAGEVSARGTVTTNWQPASAGWNPKKANTQY